MANKSGEGFLLITKFYNNPNNTGFLDTEKGESEGKADVHLEEWSVNKQENATTKRI